ncbi:ParB/RepB/Spo0J family partition protein [Helicobacter cholecystus]|uniref:ParB/RepB/Spo0J family partition protein n=1 Tax=Helicobacter cholecystus TaxID=45498 RepID=A0A3D8ITW2_9HELI|nr:ParB/RepB/Spo0J family partition protein [Helicobacter cholecystus]RDU68718.1 ParB/RepB/Spo0J family partition protein [Helicobacter cholecystus]VEJ26193.1 chromosome partitioning protein [Helicobacter cholecystus]
MAKHKKMALGRGLGEILGEVKEAYEKSIGDERESVIELDIHSIVPNPYQPRKQFDDASLEDLANSIKEYGLLQPILVYKDAHKYVLIAGERRLRASKSLGLTKIKAIVADIDPSLLREVALIENIQREDLNPIDLAYAYQELINIYSLTHEELAERLQKSRAQITNTLRLLNLCKDVQEMIIQGKIAQGHAKVLISLDEENQKKIAHSIVGQNLSVRDVEAMIKNIKTSKEKQNKKEITNPSQESLELKNLLEKNKLNFSLNDRRLTIHFKSQEEIKTLLKLIK